jgi:uncharacterized lipoprotein YddW (UPF0748 family)
MRIFPSIEPRAKLLRLGLFVLGLIITFMPLVLSAQCLSSELRGVWLTNIDSTVLFSQTNLDRAIERLKRLNFNTLYPVVYNDGFTLFPSQTMRWAIGQRLHPEPNLQNRDILQEIIDRGKQQGMTVIPWLEFGLMTPEDSLLAKLHPDWITQRRDGSQVITFGENNQVRIVRLNPMHPEVQNLLVVLVGEIVRKYAVDGIQFDDHFGLPVDMGYDPFTVNLYQAQHNGNPPPDQPQDPEWMRWRAEYITELWRKIVRKVRSLRPHAIVSLAPNPPAFAYNFFLQDWLSWAKQNLIDEVIVQVYRDNLTSFRKELTDPALLELKTKMPVAIGILTGLRIKPIDMDLIKQKVQTIRKLGYGGFSYFFYETLGDRDQDFLELQSQPIKRKL